MKKLYEKYSEYQEIEIIDKKLIKSFIQNFYPIWEKDIINFSALKEKLSPEKIKSICIYSYIGIKDELEYIITTKDNIVVKYYIEKELLTNWLKQNDLIDMENKI